MMVICEKLTWAGQFSQGWSMVTLASVALPGWPLVCGAIRFSDRWVAKRVVRSLHVDGAGFSCLSFFFFRVHAPVFDRYMEYA